MQDLDAVEALIQGLVLFQGGVLMVCISRPIWLSVHLCKNPKERYFKI